MTLISDVSNVTTPPVKDAYPQDPEHGVAAAMAKKDSNYRPEGRDDRLVSAIADPDDIKYCSDDDDMLHAVDNLSAREAWLLWIAASLSWMLRTPITRWIPASQEVHWRNRADRVRAKRRSANLGIARQSPQLS